MSDHFSAPATTDDALFARSCAPVSPPWKRTRPRSASSSVRPHVRGASRPGEPSVCKP